MAFELHVRWAGTKKKPYNAKPCGNKHRQTCFNPDISNRMKRQRPRLLVYYCGELRRDFFKRVLVAGYTELDWLKDPSGTWFPLGDTLWLELMWTTASLLKSRFRKPHFFPILRPKSLAEFLCVMWIEVEHLRTAVILVPPETNFLIKMFMVPTLEFRSLNHKSLFQYGNLTPL